MVEAGCISTKMQVARVSILHKKGDKNDMGNYRPISILPVFSKALEKAILQKMSVFEGKHKLLSDSQFGFRKGFSTELALLTQKEHILSQLEDEKLVLGLYIDFSKAFDTINHELLIRKLEHYGIRGKAGALMEYYLKHRTQIVALDDCLSDPLQVSHGVPQGSILGPFLFNMYVNDVYSNAPSALFINYADDTSIFFSGQSSDELIAAANVALIKLDEWTQKNSLRINVQKTKAVIFHTKNKNIVAQTQILLRSTPVEFVPSFKILGVIFQETMSWDAHIDFISKKLSRLLGIVSQPPYIPSSYSDVDLQ